MTARRARPRAGRIDISENIDISMDMPTIRTFKALANETRLQILQWLKDPERNFTAQEIGDFRTDGVCVKKIQEKAGLSQSTVSQYLSLLQKAGLVSAKRMGQWTYYRRDEKNIAAVVKGLRRSL